MLRKQLEYFVNETLKFFFNFDHHMLYHAYYSGLIAIAYMTFLFYYLQNSIYDGLLTVKDDALAFRSMLIILKERWENSEMRAAIINRISAIHTYLPEDVRIWRLK